MPYSQKQIISFTCEIQHSEIQDGDTSYIHCFGTEEYESKEEAVKYGWLIKEGKCWCPNCIKPKTNNWTRIEV